MSLEEWIIIAVRIAGSLPVLRWPFAGGCLAVLVDLSDLFLRGYLDLGGVDDYQALDKWLDQVYLAFFLLVSTRWPQPERGVALGLYLFRLAGFVAFELSGARWILFVFPNVFEFWFLFVAGMHRWRPNTDFSRRRIAVFLGALTSLKLLQEYVLHVGRWLDRFSVKDLVDALLWPFG